MICRTSVLAIALASPGIPALASCTGQELLIRLEGDPDYGVGVPVAAGLMVPVSVCQQSWDFGDEEPSVHCYQAAELGVELGGATQVPCDGAALCLAATPGANAVSMTFQTPGGTIHDERPVAADLRLIASTFAGGDVDRLHVQADAEELFNLVVEAADGGSVAGRVSAGYLVSGDVTVDGETITAGAPGTATISVMEAPSIAALDLRVVTPEASAASIARFAFERRYDPDGPGEAELTVSTAGWAGFVTVAAFDADDYLTLAGLPIETIGGPGVAFDAPCTTRAFCYLRGVLEEGVDRLDSFLELRAGSAVQRVPVTVVRGED